MWWHRPWYPWFAVRRWRRPYWRRRRWWRPRSYWGGGCGCLPLVILAGLMVFMFLVSMCSAPYYW